MASYTWNATVGGDWNTAADWSPNGVPGAADDAAFATGGNAYTVTGDAAAASVLVDADTVTFDGALTLGTLAAGGSAGAGGLSATDGASVILDAASFVIDNGGLAFAPGTFLEVDGTLIAQGGTADVALVTGIGANWTDSAAVTLNQLYVNQGGTYAGDVTLADGGTVNIDTSATFGGGTLTLAGSGTLYVANQPGAASGSYGLSEAISVGAGQVLTLASDPGVAVSVGGGIAGAGAVVVNGGSIALDTANSYTGPTVVQDAQLILSGANAGGTGAVFLNNATLSVQADSTGGAPSETVAGVSGANTVIDGVTSAAGSLLVFAGTSSSLNFIGGADAATVVGGLGVLTATGGSGAELIFGGVSGQDVLNTGTGPTTLVSTFGGTLNATGSAANLLVAAGGNTTLSGGSSSGNNIYFTSGAGHTVVEAGSGTSTVVATGAANTVFGATGTQDVFLSGGATQLDFLGGYEGGTNAVVGFNGSNSIQLTNYAAGTAQAVLASAVVANGNTMLTLPDNTHITLYGFTGLTSAAFV